MAAMTAQSTPGVTPKTAELDIASAVMGNRTKMMLVRHLWQHGPSRGTAITAATGISGATMSLAMQKLEKWELVQASIPPIERHGRSVIYTLDRDRVQQLIAVWTSYIEGEVPG